jgi:hypothetical protein
LALRKVLAAHGLGVTLAGKVLWGFGVLVGLGEPLVPFGLGDSDA